MFNRWFTLDEFLLLLKLLFGNETDNSNFNIIWK